MWLKVIDSNTWNYKCAVMYWLSAKEIDSAIWVQILHGAVCISHWATILGKVWAWFFSLKLLASSAGLVEYTDFISAVE